MSKISSKNKKNHSINPDESYSEYLHPSMQELQSHLLNLWTLSSVDQTYQNLFLVFIENMQSSKQQIKQIEAEIKKTYQKNSLYFLLQENLTLRTEIKNQIQEQIVKQTQSGAIKKVNKIGFILIELCDKLKNLRRINLLITQNILKIFEDFKFTRQSRIGSIGKKYIQIFIKIDAQNQFIKQSFLNEFILFQNGYDPFFLIHYEETKKSQNPFTFKKYPAVSQLFQMNISYVYRLMRAQKKMLKYMLLIDDHSVTDKERKEIINRQRILKLASINKITEQEEEEQNGNNFLPIINKNNSRSELQQNISIASTIKPLSSFVPRMPHIAKNNDGFNDLESKSLARKKLCSLRPIQKEDRKTLFNSPQYFTPKINAFKHCSLAPIKSINPQNKVSSNIKNLQNFETEDEPFPLNNKFQNEESKTQSRRSFAQSQSQKKWNLKKIYSERKSHLKTFKTQNYEQDIIEEGVNQNYENFFSGKISQKMISDGIPMSADLKKSKLMSIQFDFMPKRNSDFKLSRRKLSFHNKKQQQDQKKSPNKAKIKQQIEQSSDLSRNQAKSKRKKQKKTSQKENEVKFSRSRDRVERNSDIPSAEGQNQRFGTDQEDQNQRLGTDQEGQSQRIGTDQQSHNSKGQNKSLSEKLSSKNDSKSFHSESSSESKHEKTNKKNHFNKLNPSSKKKSSYKVQNTEKQRKNNAENIKKQNSKQAKESYRQNQEKKLQPLPKKNRIAAKIEEPQSSPETLKQNIEKDKRANSDLPTSEKKSHPCQPASTEVLSKNENSPFQASKKLTKQRQPEKVAEKKPKGSETNQNLHQWSSQKEQNSSIASSSNKTKTIGNKQAIDSNPQISSQSKIKMVPGKLKFSELKQYLNEKIFSQSYRQKIASRMNFVIKSAENTQTYLNQFQLNDQLATIALCSPTAIGNVVIYLWAPIEGVCDSKLSNFFFKKYIDYIESQTTFKSIIYAGSQISELKNEDFVLQKDSNYLRKRIKPIKRQNFQFQYFFSLEAVNINLHQNTKDSLLFSEEISPFSPANSWCLPSIINAIQENIEDKLLQVWTIDQKIKNLFEANSILEKDSYDTFQVGEEKPLFQNISMSRSMLSQVPKHGFIAHDGYMIVIGKLLAFEGQLKNINKIQMMNGLCLYFSSEFKSVQQMIEFSSKFKSKVKQEDCKFAFKMFSKQLYGKYMVHDGSLKKQRTFYSNWDLNFAWRDEIPGRLIPDLDDIKNKYGPQKFILVVENDGVMTIGIQVSQEDFLY